MCYKQLFLFYILLKFSCSVAAKKPNIVFILADDYGWNDIGYHGSEIHTPNLDRLAANGVKLENYYVQPMCTPSRTQLLSGRYQIHTGMQHGVITLCQPTGIPLDNTLLPAKLKEAGYSTHAIGKWHVGYFKEEYTPTHRGFDTFIGYLGGTEDYYNKSSNYLQYHGTDFTENDHASNESHGIYSTHFYAQKAQNVIESHDQSKPLFLYLPFQSVHSPLEVPAKYEQMYSHISDRNRAIYAGMVSAMDEAVGNITRMLINAGMWDDTILIFSTDNGGTPMEGGNNAPLRGMKGTYWEGGVHGVGFVTGPLLKRSGVISRDLIHIADWYPTIVTLAGGSLNGTQLDGYNVWHTINAGLPSPRKEILHNIDPRAVQKGKSVSGVFDTSVQAALRYGDWKILTGNPGFDGRIPEPKATFNLTDRLNIDELEYGGESMIGQNVYLFNITNDPTEHHELSAQYPAIVEMLLGRLAFYNKTAVPVFFPDPDLRCDPARNGGYWRPWL